MTPEETSKFDRICHALSRVKLTLHETFVESYKYEEIVQRLAAQIPWWQGLEMSLKDSASEYEDALSSKNWKWITLEEFVSLQRGHDLLDPQRNPGRVPILGPFRITGYQVRSELMRQGMNERQFNGH